MRQRVPTRAWYRGGPAPRPRFLIEDDGTLRPPEDLRQWFAECGVDLAKPVITTCGSGVTAAALLLALQSIGVSEGAVYDGSWSEWGARPEAPVAIL